MNEEVLDWKGILSTGTYPRAEYTKLLREFMTRERDTAGQIEQALKNGHSEEARALVHSIKEAAGNLGAKALAAASLELEIAIKAGADTAPVFGHFSSAHTDALVSMHTFLSQ
ncbi:MAG: Hpt domain-containing protein [Desulfovibrio sp.]|nr:Hpt domain-containing protein [Desulfovibrio sp.]